MDSTTEGEEKDVAESMPNHPNQQRGRGGKNGVYWGGGTIIYYVGCNDPPSSLSSLDGRMPERRWNLIPIEEIPSCEALLFGSRSDEELSISTTVRSQQLQDAAST